MGRAKFKNPNDLVDHAPAHATQRASARMRGAQPLLTGDTIDQRNKRCRTPRKVPAPPPTQPVDDDEDQRTDTPPVDDVEDQMPNTPPVDDAEDQMPNTPPVDDAEDQMPNTPPVDDDEDQISHTPPDKDGEDNVTHRGDEDDDGRQAASPLEVGNDSDDGEDTDTDPGSDDIPPHPSGEGPSRKRKKEAQGDCGLEPAAAAEERAGKRKKTQGNPQSQLAVVSGIQDERAGPLRENDSYKKKKQRDPKHAWKVHSSPHSLYKVIEGLSERQKESVRKTGFGGLLHLNLNTMASSHDWFIDRFNPVNRVLYKESGKMGAPLFEVTWADVHDVFSLPRNPGKPVVDRATLPSTSSSAAVSEIRKRWAQKCNHLKPTGRVTINDLRTAMVTFAGNSEEFARMFVLYALSCFLAPTTNQQIRLGILHSLVEVDQIATYDWCEWVVGQLCSAVDNAQKESPDKAGMRNVGGCILLLQLCYFHRQPWKGNSIERVLPLIRWWNDEKLRKRIREELASGGFGRGVFMPDLFPITKGYDLSSSQSRSRTSYPMPDKGLPGHDGFENDVLEFSRDLTRVLHLHLPNTEEQLKDPDLHWAGSGTLTLRFLSTTCVTLSETLKNISDAVKLRINKIESAQQDEEEGRGRPTAAVAEMQTPSTDQESQALEEESRANAAEVNQGPQSPSRSVSGNRKRHRTASHARNSVSDSHLGAQPHESQAPPPPSPPPTPPHDGSDDGPVASLKVLPTTRFRSKIVEHLRMMSDVPLTYKEIVADFCITSHNSLPDGVTLFTDGGVALATKVDFSSMEEGCDISSSIISCWASLLNSREHRSRLCLDTILEVQPGTDCSLQWDCLLQGCNRQIGDGATLIFVPLHLHQHFFMVVLDLDSKRAIYLDSMSHNNNPRWFDYTDTAKRALPIVSRYMASKGHPQAAAVGDYEVKTVGGSWREDEGNHDCGVYVMYFMEKFTPPRSDKIASLGIQKVPTRNQWRIKVCQELVLSKLNQSRAAVIKKVIDWYNEQIRAQAAD